MSLRLFRARPVSRPASSSRALTLLLFAAAALPAQFVGDVRIRDERGPLPGRAGRTATPFVEKHFVRVTLTDGVATTTVRQVFRNPNPRVLEGTYFFPLPDGAALGGFSLLIGGKMTPGEVLEKEKAAKIYREIVARAQDPALLEYVGRRLFQASVFPIPAQGTAELELTYSETLPRNGATVEYRYPLRTEGASPAPVAELSVSVEAEGKTPYRVVYSPSHPLDVVRKGDYAFKASFEHKGVAADRDFALVIGLGADPVGATLLTHAEAPGDGAFVLLFSPSDDATKAESQPKDVVFVADTSGSMAGEKLEQLKRALGFCVKSLAPADRFGLVTFSTEARSFRDGWAPATQETKDAALAFIAERQALGGTNIADALAVALAAPKDPTRPFLVVFLTDGLPTVGLTDVETILKDARGKSGDARVFVFGIGKDVNTALLDRLAEENRGARDYVGEREDLELKLSSFFQKVASPVLTDLRLVVEGVKVEDLYPKSPPDLFRGSQAIVTGRYRGAGEAKVRLEGKINGRPTTFEYGLRFGDAARDPAVPRLWAVRKVGYLLDQIRLHGAAKELTDEVVRLGVKYGIVTPYTSYLVLEDGATTPPRSNPVGDATRPGTTGGGGGAAPPGAPGGGGARPADGRARGGDRGGLAGGARSAGRRSGEAREEAGAPAPETKDAEADDSSFGVRRKVVEEERLKAAERVRDALQDDPVERSLRILRLRDAKSGDDSLPGALVKRAGDRTFYFRDGIYVEAAALKLDPEELRRTVIRLGAFSDEAFALLAAKPELAKVLALGEALFLVDGRAYLVTAAAPPASESRPSASRPAK